MHLKRVKNPLQWYAKKSGKNSNGSLLFVDHSTYIVTFYAGTVTIKMLNNNFHFYRYCRDCCNLVSCQ